MTHMVFAIRKAGVITADPAGQGASAREARNSSGPAAAWMAPLTPLPPTSDELPAVTMASATTWQMSPRTTRISMAIGLSRSERRTPRRSPLEASDCRTVPA